MFSDTPTRSKIDLAGNWQCTLDGSKWYPIQVPSAYDFVGRLVFQRTFDISAQLIDRSTFCLVCYGINYSAEVTINGTFIGRHVGGYSSFVVPIPENLLQVGKENAIKVTVDNELTPLTTLPPRQSVGGLRSYGGIIRDIYVLAVPNLHIADVEPSLVLSPDYKTAKLRVEAVLESRGDPSAVEGSTPSYFIAVYDKLTERLVARSPNVNLQTGLKKGTRIGAEVTVANPNLWSPDTANLYVVRCVLTRSTDPQSSPIDQYDFDYGFRDLRVRGSNVFLNGGSLQLQGVVWREDHPVFGAAMTYEALEKDIVQIKALGANLIRFLHPPHPYMLNLCDRYGLLAMEEIPAVGVPLEVLRTDNYEELTVSYLKEMVLRDRFHPSVFAWGVGDDLGTTRDGSSDCAYVDAAKRLIATMDSRPVYYATHSLADRCLAAVDIAAANVDEADSKHFRVALQGWKEYYANKPVIVARYGRVVEPGNRQGYSDPLSMEAHARYAMQCLTAIRELKIAGAVLWTFNDWRGDRPALSTYASDPYLHTMGLVNYERHKRTAYEVVQSVLKGEKVAALPIGTYSPTAPMIYVIVGLVVLIAFAFLYNSSRRFRECVNRSLTRTYNFFADIRDQRAISYPHTIFLAVVLAVSWAAVLSSVLVHFRDNLLLDNLLSQFMPDLLKQWFVQLVWSPPKFIAILSGILVAKLMMVVLLVKLFSYFVRTKVYFYHAFAVTIWAMIPFIVLIPVEMVLFRVLESPIYVAPSFVFIGLLVLWSLYRLLKGISIIYDVIPLKIFAFALLIVIGSLALVYGYLDYTQSTSLYLRHLLQVSDFHFSIAAPMT